MGPTLLPSPKSSPASTTSSTLCTPSVLSSTGTSVRAWRKVNSPRPVRTLLPSRRTTKKSLPKPPKVKVKKKTWEKNTRKFHKLSSILLPCLLLHLHLRRFRQRLLRSPSRGQQGPHGPRRIHLPPCPHRRTSGRKHAWRT